MAQQIFYLLSRLPITCDKISLAKILSPCFIIMLINLLKTRPWRRVTWPGPQRQWEIKHCSSSLVQTSGPDRWKQSWWLHQPLLWWVWVFLGPAVPSPQVSALWRGCCTPPSGPLAPYSRGCTCSISPGAPCKQVLEKTFWEDIFSSSHNQLLNNIWLNQIFTETLFFTNITNISS